MYSSYQQYSKHFFSQMKGLPQKKVSNQPGPPKLPFNFKSVRDAKLKKKSRNIDATFDASKMCMILHR